MCPCLKQTWNGADSFWSPRCHDVQRDVSGRLRLLLCIINVDTVALYISTPSRTSVRAGAALIRQIHHSHVGFHGKSPKVT